MVFKSDWPSGQRRQVQHTNQLMCQKPVLGGQNSARECTCLLSPIILIFFCTRPQGKGHTTTPKGEWGAYYLCHSTYAGGYGLRINRQPARLTNGRTYGRTYRRTNGRINGRINGQTNGLMDGPTYGPTDASTYGPTD